MYYLQSIEINNYVTVCMLLKLISKYGNSWTYTFHRVISAILELINKHDGLEV
jgi:hypothetical protein